MENILSQNRMLRLINNTRIKGKVSIASMLEKHNLLSVNQLAGKIKLLEVWKSVNVANYGIKLTTYNENIIPSGHSLRPKSNWVFNDTTRLVLAEHSFSIEAAKLWNMAPINVTSAKTLGLAKKIHSSTCQIISNLVTHQTQLSRQTALTRGPGQLKMAINCPSV